MRGKMMICGRLLGCMCAGLGLLCRSENLEKRGLDVVVMGLFQWEGDEVWKKVWKKV